MAFHRVPGQNRQSLTTKSRIHQTLAPPAIILVMLFIVRFLPDGVRCMMVGAGALKKVNLGVRSMDIVFEFQNLSQISRKKTTLMVGRPRRNLNFLNTATPFYRL
jgi:hypothetical protein